MLHAYMAYSGCDPLDGAILIFANTVREAKKLAWNSSLRYVLFDDWIDVSVRRIWRYEAVAPLANRRKLKEGIPHVIEDPEYCVRCEMWGCGITEDNLCSDCNMHPGDRLLKLFEEYENGQKEKEAP